MELTFEQNGEVQKRKSENFIDIEAVLKKMDGWNCPYVILTSDVESYIQCAGDSKNLAIECRLYSEKGFKHFQIGRLETSDVWNTITCKAGPVRVLGHEVLNINDAVKLFNFFCLHTNINPDFNKRNITKYFVSS